MSTAEPSPQKASEPPKFPKATKEDMKYFRRWIFQAVKNDADGNGVTMSYINKFLEWKEKGTSKRPEAKEIIKSALKTGTLVRVDRLYRLNANKKKAGKKVVKKKASVKKASVKKAEKAVNKSTPKKSKKLTNQRSTNSNEN